MQFNGIALCSEHTSNSHIAKLDYSQDRKADIKINRYIATSTLKEAIMLIKNSGDL